VTFFDSTKSILENIYLASGPVIALLGVFIFKQIKLAKEQLNITRSQLQEAQKQLTISSKRDSIKLAAQQIHFFSNNIIPFINKLDEQLKENKIEKVIIPTRNFEVADALKVLDRNSILEYYNITFPFHLDFLNIANSLETFATYFVQEVADEKVAFQSLGFSFCDMVESCSFTICFANSKTHITPFFNTIKLYNVWFDRLNASGIKREKDADEKDLKERIEQVDGILKTTNDTFIKPLGTE